MPSSAESQRTFIYCGFTLTVPSQVYRPEEDTFLLAENLRLQGGESVLEVGCGCGLVALLAARKAARVVATDLNPMAVEAAKMNVQANGLEAQIEVRLGDLFEPVRPGEKFDLIVFNPPYLPPDVEEPRDWLTRAWCGGEKGRKVTERFIHGIAGFLKPKGRVLLVQSSLAGIEETRRKLRAEGFSVRTVGKRRFFFEVLVCLEARLISQG